MQAPIVQARLAAIADLDLLIDIGRRTFFDTFVGTCSDDDMCAFLDQSYAPDKLREEILHPLSRFVILEDESGTLGYSRLMGDHHDDRDDRDAVELVRFYMEQRAIGTGAAHVLMQTTLALAVKLGYSRVHLGVWEKNFRAQRFYEKCGFLKAGEKIFMVGTDPQVDWTFERYL